MDRGQSVLKINIYITINSMRSRAILNLKKIDFGIQIEANELCVNTSILNDQFLRAFFFITHGPTSHTYIYFFGIKLWK